MNERRKERRKEGRKEGKMDGRKKGRKEGRKEGGKEGRKEGTNERTNERTKERRKEGTKERRKEGKNKERKKIIERVCTWYNPPVSISPYLPSVFAPCLWFASLHWKNVPKEKPKSPTLDHWKKFVKTEHISLSALPGRPGRSAYLEQRWSRELWNNPCTSCIHLWGSWSQINVWLLS